MSGAALTQKQAQALDVIREFIGQGVSPSILELQRRLGLAGRGAIHNHLAALKARGLIDLEYGRARSIRLIEPGTPEHQQVKAMKAYERQIQNGIGWTSERTDLAIKLWSEGLSATDIAKQLGGVTRNAVLGRLHRSGALKSRRAPSAPPVRAPRPAQPRPQAKAFGETRVPKPAPKPNLSIAGNGTVFEQAPNALPPVSSRMWAPLPGSTPVTIMGLRSSACKWPIDLAGAEEMHYCAEFATTGPYCCAHAKASAPAAGTKERVDLRLGVTRRRRLAA